MASPVAVLHFSNYLDEDDLNRQLAEMQNQNLVQCVVSRNACVEGSVGFGESQSPKLHDYADGVDTMKWLLELAKN